jgi:hypothetical protein
VIDKRVLTAHVWHNPYGKLNFLPTASRNLMVALNFVFAAAASIPLSSSVYVVLASPGTAAGDILMPYQTSEVGARPMSEGQ